MPTFSKIESIIMAVQRIHANIRATPKQGN